MIDKQRLLLLKNLPLGSVNGWIMNLKLVPS